MSGVVCPICPHSCRLEPGEAGICGAREGRREGGQGQRSQGGRVVPLNYGRCMALALDPTEKKPLARFHPGSRILSYGSFGCNLRCGFCQNWEIAQLGDDARVAGARRAQGTYVSPEELVEQAAALRAEGNIGIALTYNEPLVCPEYVMDVARAAQGEGLRIVLVTNGYVMPDIAREVFAVTDAANIDLKAFRQDFYTMVGAPAGLATVKRTIQTAHGAGCHVEVTTLVIPGLNDSREEMAEEAAWLAALDPELPLHISGFHPAYKMMDTPSTSPDTLYGLARVAREHLKYVYVGNV